MNSRHLRLSVYEGPAFSLNTNKRTRRQHVTCQNYLILSNTLVKISNLALLKISEEGYMNKLVNGIDYRQYHWYSGKGA